LPGPWRAGSGELAFYSVRSELKDRRAISIASWWSRDRAVKVGVLGHVVAVDVEGECGAETLGGGPTACGPCEEHHRGRRLSLPPPVASVFGRRTECTVGSPENR
jgi:hypothetical protein